jgi:hypothetical protein
MGESARAGAEKSSIPIMARAGMHLFMLKLLSKDKKSHLESLLRIYRLFQSTKL